MNSSVLEAAARELEKQIEVAQAALTCLRFFLSVPPAPATQLGVAGDHPLVPRPCPLPERGKRTAKKRGRTRKDRPPAAQAPVRVPSLDDPAPETLGAALKREILAGSGVFTAEQMKERCEANWPKLAALVGPYAVIGNLKYWAKQGYLKLAVAEDGAQEFSVARREWFQPKTA